MSYVIGLDFGNYNSFVSTIDNVDLRNTRLGGRPLALIADSAGREGIPSVFFWKGNDKYLCCRAAVTGAAKPQRNRMRYLKNAEFEAPLRNSEGEGLQINGREWTYADAIREVIQEIVREANQQLQATKLETTNLISLAYPATWGSGKREKLRKIVESARLPNGDNLKVVGTIAEPAAAALDYLSCDENKGKGEYNVLAFDLGGGTFDLALVSCYPNGKRMGNEKLKYYDIRATGGDDSIGGQKFDDIVFSLLSDKLKRELDKKGESKRS